MKNNDDNLFQRKPKEKRFFKNLKLNKSKVAEANQFESAEEKKALSHFFQLPKRWVDVTDPFYFKVYNFKTDGIIFLTTSLLIPFFILVLTKIFSSVFPTFNISEAKKMILLAGYFVPAIVATILYSKRDRQLFYGTGLAYFFWPIFSNFGLGFVFALIVSTTNASKDEELLTILNMVFQIIITLVWIIVILINVPAIRTKIGKTFAKNWKMLFLVSILTGIIMFAVSGPLLNLILGKIGINGSSDNQGSLQSGSSIIYLVLTGIYVILLAPLYEEIVYRHLYYTGIGNRTIAFFASAVMFAMIHVINTGDIEHIIPYLVGGLFLSGIFNIARGNVTYSWLSHLIYNLIGFIFMALSFFNV